MSDQTGHRAYEANSRASYWDDGLASETQSAASEAASIPDAGKRDTSLSALAGLASVPIETSMVSDLSGSLHSMFDDICDKTLPIYFGPLLGRLYLEGL
ncbi:hypothetical protein [Beijerinckia sp. L45]|uniref:hypothetical protein n=1 Tax=Beijerinckia sp. L45 TaxID=1641855 RepID=UPI00131AC80B|nr:hypothetical protein [Beijerinckia sp. L45]